MKVGAIVATVTAESSIAPPRSKWEVRAAVRRLLTEGRDRAAPLAGRIESAWLGYARRPMTSLFRAGAGCGHDEVSGERRSSSRQPENPFAVKLGVGKEGTKFAGTDEIVGLPRQPTVSLLVSHMRRRRGEDGVRHGSSRAAGARDSLSTLTNHWFTRDP